LRQSIAANRNPLANLDAAIDLAKELSSEQFGEEHGAAARTIFMSHSRRVMTFTN
jgi:hypothetical protein